MPKRKAKKAVRRVRKKVSTQAVAYNQFFGALLVAVGIGALIVFLRYLVVTWVMPANVYVVEPAQLIPGRTANH